MPLNVNGKKEWLVGEEYDTSIGIRKWPDRFFATILDKYLKAHNIYPQKGGQADSYLIDARSLINFAVPIFLEAAERYPC